MKHTKPPRPFLLEELALAIDATKWRAHEKAEAARILTKQADPVQAELVKALQTIAAQSIGDDWTAEQAVAFIKQHARVALAKVGAKPTRRLTCCCCGATTIGRQWHNRDTGYGLCTNCIDLCSRGESADSMRSNYGDRGVHYDIPGAAA